MQIGEQHLSFAQHPALDGLRLLDLDDHVRHGEDFRGGVQDARSGAPIGVVVHSDTLTRVALDDHIVAALHHLAHAARGQPDAIFENLDFLRHADAHVALLSCFLYR